MKIDYDDTTYQESLSVAGRMKAGPVLVAPLDLRARPRKSQPSPRRDELRMQRRRRRRSRREAFTICTIILYSLFYTEWRFVTE